MKTLTYAGIAEGDRATGYSLFFPDLDGCVTGADTMGELAAMAREALQLHLEGMIAHGLVLPEPTPPEDLPRDPELAQAGVLMITAPIGDTSADVIVDLPSALLDRLDKAAQARGTTRAALIEQSAEAFLQAS